MANWEIKVESHSNGLDVLILRNGKLVGKIAGFFGELRSGVKYFGTGNFRIDSKFQKEYMEEHGGLKIGEATTIEVLRSLKEEGISLIDPWGGVSPHARKFIERWISSGILEKTPEGFLKIRWEKMPTSEAAIMELIQKVRAREPIIRAARLAEERVAKMEKFRKQAKKFRRPRPK